MPVCEGCCRYGCPLHWRSIQELQGQEKVGPLDSRLLLGLGYRRGQQHARLAEQDAGVLVVAVGRDC